MFIMLYQKVGKILLVQTVTLLLLLLFCGTAADTHTPV